MKPIIGIVTRPDCLASGRKVDILYSKIRSIVVKFGGIPLLITPPTATVYDSNHDFLIEELDQSVKDDLNILLKLCDGFIFQGGDQFYDYDLYIVNYAYEHDIPSFGICLGMQLMSYSRNGTLRPLIETEIEHYSKEAYVHRIFIHEDSKLASILGGTSFTVNSRHKEHITMTDLDIVACSSDHVIEAVEDSQKKFFVGVQWHPEDMIAYDKVMNHLWNYFLLTCKECANENDRFN